MARGGKCDGLHNLKTSIDARVRSLPKRAGQELLDVYMTVKKMESLGQQYEAAFRQRERATEGLVELFKELGKTKVEDMMREEMENSGLDFEALLKDLSTEKAETLNRKKFPAMKLNY